jgi:hypothetical protein
VPARKCEASVQTPVPQKKKKVYNFSNKKLKTYSAMKKNKILSFASKWTELENIILSKVSQAQKTKNRMFSLICVV